MSFPHGLVWLYCPATRTDLYLKALSAGADTVVYDLEDSVLSDQKARARASLTSFLAELDANELRSNIIIRVNARESPWFEADLEATEGLDVLSGLRLAKVSSSADIMDIDYSNLPLHVAVEDATGVWNLRDICEEPAVATVSLGEADLRTSLRLGSDDAFDPLRSQLVLALSAAGKPPPLGAAYMNVTDDDGLFTSTRHLTNMGYRGRTAIHPRQISTILRGMKPEGKDVDRARSTLDRLGESGVAGGAFRLSDGTFVDAPIVTWARELLAFAENVDAALEGLGVSA